MMQMLMFIILITTLLNSWRLSIMVLPWLIPPMAMSLGSPIPILSTYNMQDQINTPLIMLTIWTSMLMLMSSMSIYKKNQNSQTFNMLVMMSTIILLLAFSSNSLLSFYIYFEAALIPTLLIITMWGYQPERLMASMYLMLYTMTASLPLLLGIIMVFKEYNTSSMMIFNPKPTNIILNIILIGAFLVKMPLYFLHYWLPKAHVEAPVAGSMVLASILLKLGSYGLIRMLIMFPYITHSMNNVMMTLGITGALITLMLCIRQHDLKELIAYASVSHMSMMLATLFTNSQWALSAALMLNISHGLTSSLLFSLANSYYENTNTRSLFINKGILILSPALAMWMFIALAANMGAPPFMNLLSEMFMFISLFNYCPPPMMIYIFLLSFISVTYSMTLYLNINHGKPSQYLNWFNMPNTHNLVALLHIVPLSLLITSTHLFII